MEVSPFNVHLAEYLCGKFADYKQNFSDTEREDLFWLLIHLAVQAGSGHIRTSLDCISQEALLWANTPEIPERLEQSVQRLVKRGIELQLIGRLPTSNAAADSFPPDRPPLLLTSDGQYIYFLRRRREEDNFISMLQKRISGSVKTANAETAESPAEKLSVMFSDGRRLLLLFGGPGTGKTTSICQLLAILDSSLRVFLAAPTGRAASRLAESIPEHKGQTLHRLLGITPNNPPKHSPENPLNADLLVVDEASMIDLPLMNTLLGALSPATTLLLSGDPDQLPSVEAGAVFGDLLAGSREAVKKSVSGPLTGSIVELKTVYRSNSAIMNAAAAVREGSLETLRAAVDGKAVLLKPLIRVEDAVEAIAAAYRNNMGKAEAFTSLSPLRHGPWGVLVINDCISRRLGASEQPFDGMPIVLTRNDPGRNLWNGDRAVLRRRRNTLRAVFPGKENQTDRELPLAVLSAWEPAWIQTVHKSQGSEFDSVLILLPEGADKLLTREILYTAITRARNRVEILADNESLNRALQNQVARNSRIRQWAAAWD